MFDFDLDADEGIILQAEGGIFIGENDICIDEMFLTNKNIICGIEQKTGSFSKTEIEVVKYPLDNIKISPAHFLHQTYRIIIDYFAYA